MIDNNNFANFLKDLEHFLNSQENRKEYITSIQKLLKQYSLKKPRNSILSLNRLREDTNFDLKFLTEKLEQLDILTLKKYAKSKKDDKTFLINKILNSINKGNIKEKQEDSNFKF